MPNKPPISNITRRAALHRLSQRLLAGVGAATCLRPRYALAEAAEVTELPPLLVAAETGHRIETSEAWERERERLLQRWRELLNVDDIQRNSTPHWELISEESTDTFQRKRIRYQTEADCTTEAYLLLPLDCPPDRPGVVAFHSTVPHSIRQPAGLEGVAEKAFGMQLAERGYVVICPRNYLWKANNQFDTSAGVRAHRARHTKALGMAKMLHDARVAADILASLPEVDSDRLGTVGHSLGAKQALYLAAFDSRIQCTVSSEGGIGKTMSNWDAPWYLGQQAVHQEAALDHHQLLAAVAPRSFLLIGGNADDGRQSLPYVKAAQQVYGLYPHKDRLELLIHDKGHSVPAEAVTRIHEWFEKWLPVEG